MAILIINLNILQYKGIRITESWLRIIKKGIISKVRFGKSNKKPWNRVKKISRGKGTYGSFKWNKY